MTALNLLQMQEPNALGKAGDDMEEMYSISSVSPCPVEESQPNGVVGAGETTTKLPACLSQENLNNLPLHISPLEAIRELDEAEEALSGLRSPGDVAVRAKDQLVTREESPLHSTERETDEPAFEDSEGDDAPGSVTVKTLRSIITSEDGVNLETPQTETCSSPHDISDLGCLRDDSQKHASQKWLGSGGMHRGILGTNPTLERTIAIIGSELTETGSSVTSLQMDPKERRMHTHMGVTGNGELRNSTGSVSDLEENTPEDPTQGDVCSSSTRASTPEACNSTLIDILTACQTKVEHLERLKCSSFELTIQLQSAQALATHLQQQVVGLEQERCSRQEEVQGLQEQLQEAHRALQEKSTQTARISEELRLLHLQREERTSASGSSGVQEPPNGHALTLSAGGADHGPSRVCTLL